MNYQKMLEYCTNDEQKIELLRRSNLTTTYTKDPNTGKRQIFFYWCPESKCLISVQHRPAAGNKVKIWTQHYISNNASKESTLYVKYQELMKHEQTRHRQRA